MVARQRGRKSAASRAIATPPPTTANHRPDPPSELTDYEARVWCVVVDAMPGGWFDGSSEATLVSYCKHVATARLVDEEIAQTNPEWLKLDDGLERFRKLTDMREKQTRAITACARSMRLTHQAQILPRGAGRAKDREGGGGAKPWQLA